MSANIAHIIGALFYTLAALFAGVNFYVSFAGPFYYWLRKKECHFGSVLPGLGNISLVIAAILLPANFYLGWGALLIVCMDTGGIPWFVMSMVYQAVTNQRKNPDNKF